MLFPNSFLNGAWISGTPLRRQCILITLPNESSGRSCSGKAGKERSVLALCKGKSLQHTGVLCGTDVFLEKLLNVCCSLS